MDRKKLALCALLLTFSAMGPLTAAPVYVPPGLNPGDQYRLAFVTNEGIGSLYTSADIADYNAFVTVQAHQNAALSAFGTFWRMIGSTPSVSAASNIGGASNVPIYNLNGDLIASGTSDLFDGSLNHPILYNQFGNSLAAFAVLTGSAPSGQPSFPLGGGGPVVVGRSSATNSSWISWDLGSGDSNFGLYGISDPLTVPGSIPEPGTSVLLGLGAGLLCMARKYRRALCDVLQL